MAIGKLESVKVGDMEVTFKIPKMTVEKYRQELLNSNYDYDSFVAPTKITRANFNIKLHQEYRL